MDNQAFGSSVLVVDKGAGVGGGWPFRAGVSVFRGVVCIVLDFWAKGISVWGVSGSTTTRMAEVNMKML